MISSMAPKSDLIIVQGLSVHTTLGASHWPRPGVEQKIQPLVLSITVPHPLAQASSSDTLDESVSYGSICKVAEACASERGKFSSVEALSVGIAESCFAAFKSIHEVQSVVEKKRALLHAKSAGLKSSRHRDGKNAEKGVYFVRDLELSTIIGLHPWERVEKQLVRINLEWTLASGASVPETGFDFRELIARVSNFVADSSYQTVESLAAAIAQLALQSGQHIDEVTVRVGKPSALMMADTAAVQITRTLADFRSPIVSPPTPLAQALAFTPPSGQHVAILALGSNIGDRFINIERALQFLEKEGVKIVDTSYLYETQAVYYQDQSPFINGACAISTCLSPGELLELIKRAEEHVGRTPTFRNGPREVDLDILFYDDILLSSDGHLPLQIPHSLLHEREFVLRPLNDIIPAYTHPALHPASIHSLLASLPPTPYIMRRVMPSVPTALPESSSATQHPYWTWGSQTYIMATLNMSPDSFSDGGDFPHTPHLPETSPALKYALDSVEQGAHVLDVGGYSTRPRAQPVSTEEEMGRVVPVIKALRAGGINIPISVDTFRAEVARAALLAGATWINDIRSGRGEYLSSTFAQTGSIFDVAHEFGCPLILMHSREITHMKKIYPYGVLKTVREELGERVAEAIQAGVRRWNIIVDPGYGFSKNVPGNIELVRNLRELVIDSESDNSSTSSRALRNLPILAGTSRKSYLGWILSLSKGNTDGPVPARSREWATAAAVTACILAGANMVRVHNVRAMWDVIKVAEEFRGERRED
ncbi:hypothetical protein CTheo_7775 [Ceratobasidium theobromae]|uniref:Pterin-binding domain-containing protein n=1 Tax=Ceratobasidium theobromae TaxID=1582974 RepID=A0A5N5QBI6_9AGAM|nr:hypothetical protein CTheo_7775 [Ceratobasidium theobromae]